MHFGIQTFVRLTDPEADLAPVYQLNSKSVFGSADPESVAVLILSFLLHNTAGMKNAKNLSKNKMDDSKMKQITSSAAKSKSMVLGHCG